MERSDLHKELVSVVIPVYNSAGTLKDLFNRICASVDNEQYTLEVIFVDDYSDAAVWKQLKELRSAFPQLVKIIRLTRNFGQNNATLCGLEQAKGTWIVTIDDDLEFNPEDISRLLQTAKDTEADVVYGIVKHKGASVRSLGRRFLFYLLRKFENGANLGSSFRVMHRSIVERVLSHNQDHLFINQLISWYTRDVQYVEVTKHEHPGNRSGYSVFKLFFMGLKIIFYYTSLPIKFIIYFSFLVAIACIIFASFYIIQKLTVGTLQGYSSMIVTMFGSTAIIMIGMGVLGIFVNRIYNNRIKKPNYSIKRTDL